MVRKAHGMEAHGAPRICDFQIRQRKFQHIGTDLSCGENGSIVLWLGQLASGYDYNI